MTLREEWEQRVAAGFAWPGRNSCQELGCTCSFYKDFVIAQFDAECPILDLHKGAPAEYLNPRLFTLSPTAR